MAEKIKKKKSHKGLVIFLVLFSLLVVAPVAALYICFFDNTTAELNLDENFDAEKYASHLLADSLDDTKTTKKMEISVTRDDINNLLYSATKDNAEMKKWVNQVYVDVKEDNYYFNITLNAYSIFRTKVTLDSKLTEKNVDGKQAYVFTINKATIGRIGLSTSFVTSVLTKFVSEDTLKNALSNTGLHLNLNLNDGEIVYYEEDLVSDLQNRLAKTGDSSLISSFLKDSMTKDWMTLNFNEKICASADLSRFEVGQFNNPTKRANLDLETCISGVKKMYDDKIIDYAHVNDAYSYMFSGYDASSSSVQQYFKDKDLSTIPNYEGGTITDVQAFEGFGLEKTSYLPDLLKSRMDPARFATDHYITSIDEKDIGQYIRGSGFLGTHYLFSYEDNGKLHSNYLTLDDCYCEIMNIEATPSMAIVAAMSFNGVDVEISFEFALESSSTYSMTFHLENIYLGKEKVSSELSDHLFTLMGEGLKDDSTVRIDVASKTMVVDLATSIHDSGYQTLIESSGILNLHLVGDTLQDNGQIILGIN